MSDIIIQYQNANQSYQQVIDNFVIRKKEFERVIKDLIRTRKEDSFQHYVFVGRRGSGKSTLLRRIEAEIDNNDVLKKEYIAVNLSEEQTGIYRLFDLWVYVIRDLNAKNHKIPELDFRTYKNDLNAYSKLLHLQIIKALRNNNKRLVLLIDNIDRVLRKADEETALLRELLMNYKEIRIIGGSTIMSEHFWQYDMPFYQFFAIKKLDALSLEDIKTLLTHWAGILEIKEIEKIIYDHPGKIQAIRMLTDGSPRTMLLFVDMLLNRTKQNGYQYLQNIVDKATPIYQERLGTLSAAQAKVLSELAYLWEAASVEQLIQKCSMEGKTISALLSQLVGLKFVEKLNTDTKNHLYRIEERFFNLWFNMTQGGPQQRHEAKALTEFLETWYDKAGLQNIALELSKTLQNKDIKPDYAESITHALLRSKSLEPSLKQGLYLDLTKYSFHVPDNLVQEVFEDFDQAVAKAFEDNDFEKAIEILNISDIQADKKAFGLGLAHQEMKNFELAEKYYLDAINKGHISASFNLALLYDEQGITKLAEKYYLEAIDKGITSSINNLALLYGNQGKTELAEMYYLKAIDQGDIGVSFNLAILYNNQGKTELAEKYYLVAIEKGRIDALNNLANLYANQGKAELAERYYLEAINNGNIYSYNNLLIMYYKSKNKKNIAELLKKDMKEKLLESFGPEDYLVYLIYLGDLEIFNAVFEDYTSNPISSLASSSFLTELLVHQQNLLVYEYFQKKEEAIENYKPLWYATLKIIGHKNSQKMPPELNEVVQDILIYIKAQQEKFYNHSNLKIT